MGSIDPLKGHSTYLGIDEVQGKLEIHYATSKDGNYQLLRTATKPDTGKNYSINIPSGHQHYYKVRFVNNGVYSNFSNVIFIDNSFKTPTIEEIPMGSVHPINGKSTYFKLNNFQGKFEIHYATSRDGNYQLLRTVTKEETNNQYNITIPAGHHYYVKVRFANEGAYSNYSNIIEFNNSFQTPVIEEIHMGFTDPNTGELSTYFAVDNYQGKLEIYYSESQNGTYTLARVAEKPEDENSNHYAIKVPAGKVYYFKVRFANNGVYSNYSNIIPIDNK
jgi:predicted phage tail protein